MLQGPSLNVARDVTFPEAGLAQSCVPITLGLRTNESATVMRIRWPDGFNQCEMNVLADRESGLIEATGW